MKRMPANVTNYRSSPEFTQDTVPDALRRNHATSDAVWARIIVLEGALRYVINSSGDKPMATEHLLTPGYPGVVQPQQLHHIEVVGPVRFRVDFYR